MSPMSLTKRRMYFFLFLALFLLAIPVLVLYTSGYRLGDNLQLVKTGGIYISAPGSGAEIYVNNKIGKITNILQHDFFEQNLTPGTYFIFVYKEGYWPWSKELQVHEQLVVDAYAFLVPREPKTEEITKILPKTADNPTGGPNSSYQDVLALFSSRISTSTAMRLNTETASATTTVTRDKVQLIRTDSTISAKWLGDINKAPFYFCDEYKQKCAGKINIFTSPTKIKTFDFYPGRNDVILIARKNGIYAVEADVRKIQNFALVYAGNDPDFRIGSDGGFYVKDGSAFYRVTL